MAKMCQYAVVDLEMCRVPRGERRKVFGRASELIQIGAVLLGDSLEMVDSFMTYVQPEFGAIDDYIEKLTGIRHKDVAKAPFAKEALDAFLSWLPEDAKIVSWSDNDLRQIKAEIEGKGYELPEMEPYFDSWIDCQVIFGEKMHSERCYRLSEALNFADIDYLDGEHDALVDAKNTAMLFAKMEREPVLKLSPYLVEEETHLFNPFANLLSGFAIA